MFRVARATWKFGLVLLIIALLTSVVLGEGQIRVLAIGQVLPGEAPIAEWFESDPLVDYVLVPTDVDFHTGFDEGSFRRFIRLYFPRTRKALVEGFDFMVFPDGRLDPFTSSQMVDMKYAVENGVLPEDFQQPLVAVGIQRPCPPCA